MSRRKIDDYILRLSDACAIADELDDYYDYLQMLVFEARYFWKARLDHVGYSDDGWFYAGIMDLAGKNLIFRIPEYLWNECPGIIREKAPK